MIFRQRNEGIAARAADLVESIARERALALPIRPSAHGTGRMLLPVALAFGAGVALGAGLIVLLRSSRHAEPPSDAMESDAAPSDDDAGTVAAHGRHDAVTTHEFPMPRRRGSDDTSKGPGA